MIVTFTEGFCGVASPYLELQNVAMKFGKETLFSGLNLQIEKGECFVLIGPSGVGKSVLLKLFAGLILPREGEVRVKGQNLHTMKPTERHELQLKMGMLFQKNALFDSMKVSENIAFPLSEVRHLAEQEIEKRIVYFLEEVGLSHARELYPDEISGGMQKRLGIARALALDPEIILYDDPTAGLDPITSHKIADLIQKLQQEKGSTVVVITNDMARAFQMADRIGVFIKGELIITGTVEQTKKHNDPRVYQFIRGDLKGPLTE